MSFADLKKNKGLAGVTKLQDELEKLNTKSDSKNSSSSSDDRFWRLQVDKSGVGAAVIRFLPESEGDSLPWVTLYEHAFQGPGGWYIEKSRTSLGKGEKDPVFEYNNELWTSGVEANKDLARKQKRTQRYISNILVVKDPANPENEGKIFLFKYGKKIFQKIQEAMIPEHDPVDQKDPLNPFCPWNGANFKLKCRKVEGYPNYDQSTFSSPSALHDGDDVEIEALWKKQHSLSELTAPSEFKSYEELKKRLDRVLGLASSKALSEATQSSKLISTKQESASDLDLSDDDLPSNDVEVDDDLSYLQALANED
jgi:hypothetical protein